MRRDGFGAANGKQPVPRMNANASYSAGVPRVVEPARGETDGASLAQLLAVSVLGAVILYLSLKGGWRAGSIMGLAMVVLPLIEAMIPGFTGKFMSGMEQVRGFIHSVGVVVVVLTVAVLGWIGLTKPQRPAKVIPPTASEFVRKPSAPMGASGNQGDARQRSGGEAKPQFFKQGRPMPSDGPGSELYIRRLRPE